MKKNLSKIVSVFLAVIMLLGSLPLLFSESGLAPKADAVIRDAGFNGINGFEDTNAGKNNKFVFYPEELESAEKAYPVIIWANGTACPPALYLALFKGFVKEGFVVVASSEVMSADGTEQIDCVDYILNKSRDKSSVLYGKIDPSKIVAMGQSQGGRSTVNASSADPRFCCAVSIAGSSYIEEAVKLYTPTLFITGTLDFVVSSEKWVKPAYEAAKAPAVYASLKGATHTTCLVSPEQYVRYATLWINAWANNDTDALKAFLPGGELSKDKNWQDFACKNISYGDVIVSALTHMSIFDIIKSVINFVVNIFRSSISILKL